MAKKKVPKTAPLIRTVGSMDSSTPGSAAEAEGVTDALIRRLQNVTAHRTPPPPPPANPGVVAAAEAEVGFRLPDLLRRMYLEVANGGFGPFYGLLGLDGGATDDLGYNALDQCERPARSCRASPAEAVAGAGPAPVLLCRVQRVLLPGLPEPRRPDVAV